MLKKYNKIIIFIIFFIVVDNIIARPPTPPDPPTVPISGGLIGLLLLGVAYAISKIKGKE